jgi:hypothetical protein
MGGGPNRTRDASKGAPRNPLLALMDGSGDVNGDGLYSYCQLEHALLFRVARGVALDLGGPARLVLSNPPQIAVGSDIVGELDPRHSFDMAGCMEAGYRMVGWIQSFDADERTGVAIVRGEPPE